MKWNPIIVYTIADGAYPIVQYPFYIIIVDYVHQL